MLLGLAFPTDGRAKLLGHDVPRAAARALPRVGALVEGPAFYPHLSGRDNLMRLDAVGPRAAGAGRADRGRRVDRALERVGLAASGHKRFRAYSLGMRQRLALAGALVRPCELLVLDEPTNALDPQGTREVRNLVRSLATEGTTVFLSSHLLSEVEQLCSHVAVLQAGRVAFQGTIERLRTAQQQVLRVETADADRAVQVLSRLAGVTLLGQDDGMVRAELSGALPEDCNAALVQAGVRVRGLTTEVPSLEEAFVALTGEGFDVAQ
jgi:ABC-2 type transport system ATP-binding protein